MWTILTSNIAVRLTKVYVVTPATTSWAKCPPPAATRQTGREAIDGFSGRTRTQAYIFLVYQERPEPGITEAPPLRHYTRVVHGQQATVHSCAYFFRCTGGHKELPYKDLQSLTQKVPDLREWEHIETKGVELVTF